MSAEKKHQCSATIFGERVRHWQCQRAGVVCEDGKWYCRQHDPQAEKRRKQERDAKWAAHRQASEAIRLKGQRLLTLLGVTDGSVGYTRYASPSKAGYTRTIEMSFADAERLIERLKGETT